MRLRTFVGALPVAVAILLMAVGCSRKESATVSQPAAPAPETTLAPAESAAAAAAVAVSAAVSDAGAKVYKSYCESCHGTKGRGDGVAAAALNPKPADFAIGAYKYDANGNGAPGDVDDIKAVVHDGAAKHGGSPLMAPWPMLTPDQLQAVAEYVKSLHGA